MSENECQHELKYYSTTKIPYWECCECGHIEIIDPKAAIAHTVNITDRYWVQLSSFGKGLWRDWARKGGMIVPLYECDLHGWIRLPMHDIMSIFAPYVHHEKYPSPFESNTFHEEKPGGR